MEIPSSRPITHRPVKLSYDKEWLSILRAFHPLLKSTFGIRGAEVPEDKGEEFYRGLIKESEEWVEENVFRKGKMNVPENFEVTAPVMEEGKGWVRGTEGQPREYTNPQMVAFCEMLGLENYWDASEEEREGRREKGPDEDEFYGGGRGGRGGGGGGSGGNRGGRGRGGGGGGGGIEGEEGVVVAIGEEEAVIEEVEGVVVVDIEDGEEDSTDS
ncbi:lariat debranching enzyme, C-terminal domain-containing protein [Apiosordaria backusii]|uniref:Lariat debranching enzyme, C-terminal domain-containing protein n=1 Tax=Apiosordaria backusii TaxID=314023 RepID=A0AA40EM48_9PEZI|nr:lariat debranching enzyme, C-terminal domain-containing protein [Apiosordaria backusii]